MTNVPNVGDKVYYVSPNITVESAFVQKVNPPDIRLSVWVTLDDGKGKYRTAKRLREIEFDPAIPAREVQSRLKAKLTVARNRVARMEKALKKAEAHLPPEERAP